MNFENLQVDVAVFDRKNILGSDPEILYYIEDWMVSSTKNYINSGKENSKASRRSCNADKELVLMKKVSSPFKRSDGTGDNTFQNDFKPDNFFISSDTEINFTNSLAHIKDQSFKNISDSDNTNEDCLKF